MHELLEVHGLTVEFEINRPFWNRALGKGDAQPIRAVDQASFSLATGEILGIVGESGSGKSTTGMSILQLIDSPVKGDIRFDGKKLEGLRGHELLNFRRKAQMIFQDPYQSLNPRFTVRQIVGEPLTIHKIAFGKHADEMVADILDEVGLRPAHAFLDRFTHELSGGQRQRVAIARAVALRPILLVADEPVSMLDVSVRAGILRLLQKLNRELGLSVLYISHDLSTVRYLCDRILIMYRGQIVESGLTHEVLDSPRHPYTQALLAAVPRMYAKRRRERVNIPGDSFGSPMSKESCIYRSRCPKAFEACAKAKPPMHLLGKERAVACHLHDNGQTAD